MKEKEQRDLHEALDLESYKCFRQLQFVGQCTSFSNTFFIGMGAFRTRGMSMDRERES
jgi:hypothetical protein